MAGVDTTWSDPATALAGGGLDVATGDTLDATYFDKLASNLNRLGGTTCDWVDWTPTVTQLGAVTVTVGHAKYLTIGKLVLVTVSLNVTGAGTITNEIVIGAIPAGIAPVVAADYQPVGEWSILDQGTGVYGGILTAATTATLKLAIPGAAVTFAGVTPNFALANTDVIRLEGWWRIA